MASQLWLFRQQELDEERARAIICIPQNWQLSSVSRSPVDVYKRQQVDIGTIVGDGSIVNVYRHPWPESDVVLNALKGAKFVVVTIDEESGWYQVGFPDGVGYIEPQYLDIRSTTIDNAFFG